MALLRQGFFNDISLHITFFFFAFVYLSWMLLIAGVHTQTLEGTLKVAGEKWKWLRCLSGLER